MFSRFEVDATLWFWCMVYAVTRADLNPARCFVVYAGQDRYPLAEGIEVISLAAMVQLLAEQAAASEPVGQ